MLNPPGLRKFLEDLLVRPRVELCEKPDRHRLHTFDEAHAKF